MSARKAKPSAERIRTVLRRTFGLKQLRDGQEAVIGRLLSGLSTLAVMPTGAGKSLCYQLPAVLLQGRTLVISPLIALMKDQCESVESLGIPAVQYHSALNAADKGLAEKAIRDGSARIVFTTPEQLEHHEFINDLMRHTVALLVVDEAHCLSQWGFDFRPAFLSIGSVVKQLGDPAVLALTATATEAVIDDIVGLLSIPRAGVIGTDLFRPNLHYRVEHFSRSADKLSRLISLVSESGGSGLVYVATVKAALEVQEALVTAGEPAGLYHGKLSALRRHAAQDAFMSGEERVMVATNAFGLGIDKPDIRFVVHYQIPTGLDAYCQESGRAGRDGLPAQCTLMFVDADRNVQQFFLGGRYPRLEDFRAVVKAVADGEAVTRDDVLAASGAGKKGVVALNMLMRRGLVQTAERDTVRLSVTVDDAALASLASTGENKAEADHAALEAMVAYAQSGRCRWGLLLDNFDADLPSERCGTCDNCLRLQAHEREQQGVVATPDQVAPLAPPAFAVGDRVRTRRHGLADVVAVDSLSVTVLFANGQTRSFQPQFLARARRPRAQVPAAA